MTHYQILLRELAAAGRVTYQELQERYADSGYTYNGFTQAAMLARRRGVASGGRGRREG